MALILCPMCFHRRDFTLARITKRLTWTRGPLVGWSEKRRHGGSRSITRVRRGCVIQARIRENPMLIHRSSRWHPDRTRVVCLVCHVKRPFFFRNAGTLPEPLTGSPRPGTHAAHESSKTEHVRGIPSETLYEHMAERIYLSIRRSHGFVPSPPAIAFLKSIPRISSLSLIVSPRHHAARFF